MRQAVWPRWAGVSLATLALAALAASPVFAKAESTPTPPTTTTGHQAEPGPAAGPWLGVQMQALTDELRTEFKYKGQGVLISRVVTGSPAEKAGLKHGDIITTFNSRTVDSPASLTDMVQKGKVDQAIQLRIVRDGRSQTVNAKLAAREADEDFDLQVTPDPDDVEIDLPRDFEMHGPWGYFGRGRLGVRVEPLNPDLAGYFNVPGGKGLLVLEVMKETPAEKAGIKAGDVITQVGDRTVESAEQLADALPDQAGKASITVLRKGAKRTVQADIEERQHAIRIRRGDPGMIRVRDFQGTSPELRREIDDLRRQIEDLRRELDRMNTKK